MAQLSIEHSRPGGNGALRDPARLWRTAAWVAALCAVLAFVFFLRVLSAYILQPGTVPGDSGDIATPDHTRESSTPDSGLSGQGLMAYADIPQNNPFGTAPADPLRPLGVTGTEPSGSTRASGAGEPLSLAGTIVKENGYRYAIFEQGSKPRVRQSLVREGEQLDGGATVVDIRPGRATVVTGQSRTVYEVRDIPARTGTDRGRRFRTRSRPRQRARTPVRRVDESTYRLSKESIKEALRNPEQIMTEARLLPYVVDGEQKGFVVRELKQGGIYDALGLKNGDILLKVNELALESPDSALQAFGALRGLSRVRLEIIRGGDNRTILYHID